MGIIKVSIFQKSLPEGLNLSLFKKLAALKSDFLVFPEFFFADSGVKDLQGLADKSQYALDWLLKLNDSYKGTIIGGSLILQEDGKMYNATPIISGGSVVDWYKKRNLTEEESAKITPGTEPGVYTLQGHRFSVLICNDVNREEYIEEISKQDIKLIFAVMSSPLREETVEEKHARDDKLFSQPAQKYGLYLVKCGSTGRLFGKPLQGRSMTITPSGVSWRVAPHEEQNEIIKTIMINIQ